MPCDTITTQSIKLAKAMPELVKQTLEDMGWKVTTSITTRIVANKFGESVIWEANKGITIRGSNTERLAAEISKAYSKRAVTWAAQRAGWQVTTNNNNSNTLNIIRR